MNLDLILKIILLIILLYIIIYVFKLSKSLKLNNRISKYTINNNSKEISIGDYILNIYLYIKRLITKILNKSIYFKKFIFKKSLFKKESPYSSTGSTSNIPV